MTHITIERARLEQWLKAIDMFAGEDRQKALHEAGKEMLQALAARPVQEPVCKECNGSGEIETGIGMLVCTDCPPAAPVQPVAWSDAKQAEINDWFLSLPAGRQAVLLENKWTLAGAAFLAGKSTQPPAPVPLTDLETLQAIVDEYDTWIRHHAAGHDYDDFLRNRAAEAAHKITKGGAA